jgi:hypothetical protein
MKKISLSMLTLLVAAISTEAKDWKIGPSSVSGMDFASINAAMESAEVNAGDVLYLDQYYNESAEQTVSKSVTIIGTGYDTSFTDERVVAVLTNSLLLKADNIVIKSVRLQNVQFFNKECILDRCYATGITVGQVIEGMSHVYSCYIEGNLNGRASYKVQTSSNTSTIKYVNSSFDIQNNIVSSYVVYLTNSIINNNVLLCSNSNISSVDNSQITNNMIYTSTSSTNIYNLSSEVNSSGSGNTIEHNVFNKVSLSIFPSNKVISTLLNLFVKSGNYSDYYKLNTELADGNIAIGYATDGGDVGCHGGMFGCPSGGRPQYIPYFTKVTVGSRTENGKLPVSVSIKIQDE